MDWKDTPRTKDRLILLGMNPRNRALIPWDADAEFWFLNEMSHQPWVRRFDRAFQIHPRWDWSRLNNFNDPNHLYWLQNVPGTCRLCDGTGFYHEELCVECVGGQYTPPADRAGKLIYMQKAYEDIPGSIALPFDVLTEMLPDRKPYFTSTFSYMLSMGLLLGFPTIEIYGFGMESETEYANQRACAEYWMGFGRGRGTDITAPGSGLMAGDTYGFTDNKQGFAQMLEIRQNQLRLQREKQVEATNVSWGALGALMELKTKRPDDPDIQAAFDKAFDGHYKNKVFAGTLNGTLAELDNIRKMWLAYNPTDESPLSLGELLAMQYQRKEQQDSRPDSQITSKSA